jgi:hypothetical protein
MFIISRRHEMTIEQQAMLDMPLWVVIVFILLGGVAGEMWRADKDGVRGRSLIRRVGLRSGSSMICGFSAIMVLHAGGVSTWMACAIGCLTAMAGTEVAIGLYERWIARRIGAVEVQTDDPDHKP